jgi:hypothetical protein
MINECDNFIVIESLNLKHYYNLLIYGNWITKEILKIKTNKTTYW